MLTEFGELARRLWTDSNLAAKQVAHKMGISISHISEVLHGRRNPTPYFVRSMCTALKLSSDEEVQLHTVAARMVGYVIRPFNG